ncbi:Por secretion system C-terminal sorting domain-containing protein [Algibacter lectus]|uniref:G8 domain-containing protein n=1 Tax=Algibacter lectus TaxID=221126 RepID=UPI0008E7C263|nr:G8 domain-containing protein [Algibacter lectus]SFB94508.1 Por secretion system C-terminal sorting domain-containing protein [Algibacter lectus]
MKRILLCLTLLCVSFITVSYSPINEKKGLVGSKYNCLPNALLSVSAVSNGDWNSTATWSTNQIPSNLDDVIIPNGIRVTLSGTMEARSVSVSGILSPFNLTTDFELITEGIMIQDGGLMQVGSVANPYSANGIVTLTGSDPNGVLMGNAFMGTKLIGVMSGARLELHGIVKKTWTQLNVTASSGVTSITLKETIDWEIGDEIVIASTDFDPHQAEKRTITSVSGTTIGLNTPLTYMHWGVEQIYNNGTVDLTLDERAEVGLLTHNLKVRGDASSETNGFGGHIMSMPGSVSRASNIELFRMGQKSKVAKYPWHWHLVSDATGQYIKNAGIHHSFNRLITVHGTNNTVVEGNVGFDFIGHGFFLEDGDETGNSFKNNLGVLCKRPVTGEEVTPNDIGIGADRGVPEEAFPSTFWITNPNNDFIGNVAAGSDGSGFWHLVLEEAINESGSSYEPGIQPMGIFDDNKAHSNLFNWGIDSGVDKVTEELTNGHYRPQNANGTQFVPIINRFTGYKSVDRNVWIRANKMDFHECTFADNGRSDFFSYTQTLFNSLVVGKSDNIGTPTSASEIEAGRTLPYPSLGVKHFNNGFRGHSIYDGPSGIVDTHFVGFDSNGANAYCFQTNGASRKSTNHFARGITFDPSIPEANKFDFTNSSHLSFMYLSGIIDEDGSLTGSAGSRVSPIISSHPNGRNLYEKGANAQQTNIIEKPEWGAWVTSVTEYNYLRDLDNLDKSNGPFTPRYFISEYPDKTTHAVFNVQTQNIYFDAPVISNDLDYKYYFQYHKFPNYMIARMDGAKTNSESTILVYPNMPSSATVVGATEVANFTQLKNSATQAYFFKDNTIYAKIITNRIAPQPAQWQFGQDFRFQNLVLRICVDGNCNDRTSIQDFVTLIDYGKGDDSRDTSTTTDGLTAPTFSYGSNNVSFSVENNGNGIEGYTDYTITLEGRQVWEYFNTLYINYMGPDVEVLMEDTEGGTLSLGTYAASDIENIRIGQDSEFDKFTKVKKLILRFHESNMGDINSTSSSNVQINSIKLGADVPANYSVSSTSTTQDSDGDGILDADEISLCRDADSASDFALEFNSDSPIFDDFTQRNADDTIIEELGVLKGTASSSSGDVQIIKNGFLDMLGSDISTLSIRIKANIASTRVQIFWQNENSGPASGRTVFTNYTGNGNFQTLTFNVSSNSEWVGQKIKGFRIDPVSSSNVSFEIDWIRANNAVDPASTCVPLSVDTTINFEDSISLYPNPVASGQIVNIKGLESYSYTKVVVYDITGKIINSQKIDNTISLENANAGMYFVKFLIPERGIIITKKLLKK